MRKTTVVLGIVIALMMLASIASADGGTTVSVANYTVTVGQEFTVPVRIEKVSNLYGYDVRLPHDQAILQGVQVNHGYFLNQPWYVIRNGFWTWGGQGCNGYCAWYALTSLRPARPVSGNGTLVYVTYRALQPGVVTLTPWTQLSAPGGVPIPVTMQSGTVTVVATQDK